MASEETEKFASAYIKAEADLLKHLKGLQDGGELCGCSKSDAIEIIDDSSGSPKGVSYCLECGGVLG